MKKTTLSISCLALLLLSSFLTACGGQHNTNHVHAIDLISGQRLILDLEAHNYADTGHFSNFTSPLNFNEMTFEMRSRKEIRSATQIGDYLQLDTDSGEFYLKYNGVSDNEFRYSLFAEVGLADDFGENIYIPLHMLIWFENCDYPATATPFKGQVYFSKQFSLADVRDYYKSKGIYTVEQVNDNTLFVDSKDGYTFSVQLTNYNDYVLFSLTERKN